MTTDLEIAAPAALLPDPFLHVGNDRIYSPLQDLTLESSHPDYSGLRAILEGSKAPREIDPLVLERLQTNRWLIEDPEALAYDFRLKYVSLETHTVCNQRCFFCPVSFEQRASHFMSTEFFERIVLELSAYRSTVEGVWLMLYNEPSLDKRMVEQCLTLRRAGLPPVVNTNASAFTPEKSQDLIDAGGLRLLSVNISTFNREDYARDRGVDQLEQVLHNLDFMKDKPVAEEMIMMVLGQGDEDHERQLEAARERYGDSQFDIQGDEIMDRAGFLEIGRKAKEEGGRLAGCENVGSRPLQHLHITPHGKVVFCCQDYDETHIVGDLTQDSVAEVLCGEALADLRRQAYGLVAPHDDFMCSSCVFALRDFGDDT